MDVFLAERTSDEENQETSAVIGKCRNAGKKVSPASAFLRLVKCVRLASAFRHPSYAKNSSLFSILSLVSLSVSNSNWMQ